MKHQISLQQALEQSLQSQHIEISCGQSRSGGLETSNRTRWSRSLGRVADAYVQGTPKGGGALCVRRVSNTRLRLVPPIEMEVSVQRKTKPLITALCIAVFGATVIAAPAYAQSSYDDILNSTRQDSMNRKRADQEANTGSSAPTPIDPTAPWMTVESVGNGSAFNACIFNHRYKMGESEALASRNCLYNQTIPNDREVASIDSAAAERERKRLAAQQVSYRAAEEALQRRLAYANSPAGRAAAQKRDAALSADYRRRGLACENGGGTWGYRHGNAVYRMKPGDIPAWYDRDSMACYHL